MRELVFNLCVSDGVDLKHASGDSPYLPTNNAQPARKAIRNGRSYLVADMSMLVPGVLAGSKGPLLYRSEDVSCPDHVKSWDGMPITRNHPYDPRSGRPLSATEHGVIQRQGMGVVRDPHWDGNKLKGVGWFDEERVRELDPGIHKDLLAGKPIELSTGLYTDNVPTPGVDAKGRPYDAVAQNYQPDHLAVLVGSVGACSRQDGCGVLVNAKLRELVANADPFYRELVLVNEHMCWGRPCGIGASAAGGVKIGSRSLPAPKEVSQHTSSAAFATTTEADKFADANISGSPPSASQKNAIDAYRKSNAVYQINQHLRGQSLLSKVLGVGKQNKETMKQLDSLVSQSKTTASMTALRGFTLPAGKSVESMFKPGQVFKDYGYVSTTLAGNVADRFSSTVDASKQRVMMSISVPKGSSAYHMPRVPGEFDEAELLLGRGASFAVHSVSKRDDGVTIVHVKYIGSHPTRNSSVTENARGKPKQKSGARKSKHDRFIWNPEDLEMVSKQAATENLALDCDRWYVANGLLEVSRG